MRTWPGAQQTDDSAQPDALSASGQGRCTPNPCRHVGPLLCAPLCATPIPRSSFRAVHAALNDGGRLRAAGLALQRMPVRTAPCTMQPQYACQQRPPS
jgi:hypothetical protein